MTLNEILTSATLKGASDIFLISGIPVTFKIKGMQDRQDSGIMKPDSINAVIKEIYDVSRRDTYNLDNAVDDDFSFSIRDLGRFRVNIFRQRGSLAAVIRVIRFGIPDPAALGIPENVLSLADNRTGLVLVTGAAGAGHRRGGLGQIDNAGLHDRPYQQKQRGSYNHDGGPYRVSPFA